MQEKLKKNYDDKSKVYYKLTKKIKIFGYEVSLAEVIMMLITDAAAYYVIIKGYFDGAITIGDMSMFLATVLQLGVSLRLLSAKLASIKNNLNMSSEYYSVMDDKCYYSPSGSRLALPSQETLEVRFENVSFKYPNSDVEIIKDLNLTIHKGEKLAIVGINGAGKTTIIKLLCGLFKPTSGKIFINNIDITEFNADEYYKMFSVVFQDFHIYACSVIENIIGNDKSEEAISFGKECIAKVSMKEKIESLPQGYNTQLLKVIEENGVDLSGGQTQKLAIARALYKNANMVILDEPTAALDALAEANIYSDFDELVKHKTAIYISHRLSSTKFCDHIAFFTKSGLEEYGTHAELIGMKGQYYHMFTVQGKYYQEGDEQDDK